MNNKLSNSLIVWLTIITIAIVIAIPTAYKVYKIHKNRSRMVVEKEILEAAEKCFNEDKCSGEYTTLNDLYNLKYLDEEYDPVTKRVFDENTKIVVKDGNYSVDLY